MNNLYSMILEAKHKLEEHKEGLSILDKIDDDDFQAKELTHIIRPNGPCIYAFVTSKYNDAVKIGYTDQHPLKRIEQWNEIYNDSNIGKVHCLGWWSCEEFNEAGERVFFWDHEVHKKVVAKRYLNVTKDEFMKFLDDNDLTDVHYSKEFYKKYKTLIDGTIDLDDKEELSKELLEDLIIQMRQNIKNGTNDFKVFKYETKGQASDVWGSPAGYSNTGLQEECIKKGIAALGDGKTNLLMAAVMRFGKTHAAYEIVKNAKIKGTDIKNVIVISAKADVRKAWRDDVNHKDFYKDFVFIEINDEYKWAITAYDEQLGKLKTSKDVRIYDAKELLDSHKNKTIIFFFTLQDLSGSNNNVKQKHKVLFDIDFDLMIIDETHYGSHSKEYGKQTGLSRDEINEIEQETNEMKKEGEKITEELERLRIKPKAKLQVSGTPYYILASNEMIEKDSAIISDVSYVDMIEAKQQWEKDHPNEDKSKSPYFGIPTLHKLGLRLNKKCRDIIKNSGATSSLNELFVVKDDGKTFKYESAIKDLIVKIFGRGNHKTLALLENKHVEGNKVCNHTIMVMPRIIACEAMERLLIETGVNREVIRIVGDKAKITDIKTLNDTLNELDSKGKKSVILTVNKFLTGVSMPLLDSMIYFKNASSPQEYDQSIFRLCTRNVKNVVRENGEKGPSAVNRKDNVYLIDFNIENMINMMANSAHMKAFSDNDPTLTQEEKIKKYFKQEADVISMYGEGVNDSVLGEIHQLSYDDLMKVYTNYNSNKTFNDIINDDTNLFDSWLFNEKVRDEINKFSYTGIAGKNKNKVDHDVEENDEVDLTDINHGNVGSNDDENDTKRKSDLSKSERKEFENAKKQIKEIIKRIIYCNVCLDNPYYDIDEIIKKYNTDNELKQMFIDSEIKISDIRKLNSLLNYTVKNVFNNIIRKINWISDNLKNESPDEFLSKISDLGALSKVEHITPASIVNKMINKIDESEFKKAKSILFVNETCCEFFNEIYKRFGKKVALNCRIVASSRTSKNLIIKTLKNHGLNDYINEIVLDIKDTNGNNKYDINDFLKMDNNDILKMNNGKKFDICLMNPPYGNRKTGDEFIHHKFVAKCLNICDKQIVVMPNKLIYDTSRDKHRQYYKKLYDNHLLTVEEYDSSVFTSTSMSNVAIFNFNKTNNGIIKVIDINGNVRQLSSLLDISQYSDFEKEFIKYIEINIKDTNNYLCQVAKNEEQLDKWLNNLIKQGKDVFLTVNSANGAMNGTFFSKTVGKIFTNIESLKNNFKERKGAVCNIMLFDTIKTAENCKNAMMRPLLRFALYRTQDDQNLRKKCFAYIPNIDWSDDRVKTDEGLLEVCGCPKDKCKEYADYCKKIIDEVDRKKK